MDMNESKKRRAMITYVLIGLVVLAVLNAVVAPAINTNPVQEVPYTQLLSMADEGKVDEVEYNLSSGEIKYSSKADDGTTSYYSTTYWPNDSTLLPRLEKAGATATTHIEVNNSGMFIYLLTFFLPIIVFIAFGWWMNKKLRKAMGDDNPTMSFGGFGQGLGARQGCCRRGKGAVLLHLRI